MKLKGLVAVTVLLISCGRNSDSENASSAYPEKDPYVVVLGIAQDGGYPHIGCERECCQNVTEPARVSSVGLIDPRTGHKWLFDATPDMSSQITSLNRINSTFPLVDGIFPTHAHIGHYTGLMYLGREALGADKVKVYAMPRMKMFLESNGPWDQLVNLSNIDLIGIYNNDTVTLANDLLVIPFTVPHRDEYSETVGYKIIHGDASLVYLPDIDKWEKWKGSLEDLVKENDYVLIDGTFYTNGEIPGRDMSEIPHPFVEETMAKLIGFSPELRNRVFFIHFNHTNPAINNREKTEKEISGHRFNLSYDGLTLPLKHHNPK